MTAVKENIKRILEERAFLWENQGKALADIANLREFTAEERVKFEAVEADFGAFGQRIKALELSLDQERQINEFAALFQNDNTVRTAVETELRSVLSLREKSEVDFSFTGKEMTRALATGTAGAGGNLIPATFWDMLIQPLRNFVSVLNAGATQITTASGENITIPRVSSYGAAAAQVEATQLTGSDPAFDQTTLKAFKFGDFRDVSRELIDDSAIDIEGLITKLIGQNIGLLLGQKLSTGTGINQTAGIVTASTVGVTGATGVSGAATFDNIIDLFYSIGAPYRGNGSWIIADQALGGIRKLKDSTGRYLWEPSVVFGAPDLILGRPVFGDPNMAAPAIGAKPILFGDISAYWVRFVNSLRIERSDQALFGTDQVAFRGVLRADGLLTDPSAVKTFQGGAS
ncbi:phage major capsid protein [Cryobacterium sp. RTC2.1]|uniref:phage major capsid protein n=1 Tax=Cryobacterium sp. RTC2.1 TaxID=3048634 RepID=UPI002B23BC99|nr:phage major capsid protein [Cryobacterium sp. RTC2.1]MEB0001607.1 phage major capsid protein [Cryobacterium sp. RTC2.1]